MDIETQIENWKKAHGDVFKITSEDKVGYIRKPNRNELKSATTLAQTDPLGFVEIVLENCWLGGDEQLKTDDAYFMGISSQLEQIIEVKQAEIVKL